jgi:hypothetical protein
VNGADEIYFFWSSFEYLSKRLDWAILRVF